MNKLSRTLCTSLLLVCSAISVAGEHRHNQRHNQDQLFQYSTINALMEGYFEGDMTYRRLQRKGNFGLGTFNSLDGEMLALDGYFYQMKADGKAYPVSPEARTPFAIVSFFHSEQEVTIPANLNFHGLEDYLDKTIGTTQLIHAIRIDGEFRQLKLRSIPAQKPPYRRLAEVNAKDQVEFDYQNAKGTLVGYRFPAFMDNLNVTGYHFHFIDDKRQFGGHVLSLETTAGLAKLDSLTSFKMKLPQDQTFSRLTLDNPNHSELKRIEKGS